MDIDPHSNIVALVLGNLAHSALLNPDSAVCILMGPDCAYVERLLKDRLPQLVPDCSTFQSPELLQLYLEEVDDRLDAAKAGGIVLFIRRIKSHICCVSGQRGGVAAARERHVQSVNRGVGYGYAEDNQDR